MKERNANLDVFRCLVMFLIVLGHSQQHGAWSDVRWMNTVFMTFVCWHVDAFLSLSGWFGVRFSCQKFWRLWAVIAFYSAVSIAVGRFVLGEATPLRISGGWYGNTYLCLMLVAPLLNAGIDSLASKGNKHLWSAWAGFAAVIWINWLSRNSYIGMLAYDIQPFSLVQMVFVYFTMRVVRLTNLLQKVRLWHCAFALGAFALGAFADFTRTNYLAPYVMIMALAMFILFERFIRLPACVGRLAVWAAPSMFGVYLIHEVSSYGQFLHRVPSRWLSSLGLSPWLCVLGAALFCFVLCIVLDALRRNAIVVARRLFRC